MIYQAKLVPFHEFQRDAISNWKPLVKWTERHQDVERDAYLLELESFTSLGFVNHADKPAEMARFFNCQPSSAAPLYVVARVVSSGVVFGCLIAPSVPILGAEDAIAEAKVRIRKHFYSKGQPAGDDESSFKNYLPSAVSSTMGSSGLQSRHLVFGRLWTGRDALTLGGLQYSLVLTYSYVFNTATPFGLPSELTAGVRARIDDQPLDFSQGTIDLGTSMKGYIPAPFKSLKEWSNHLISNSPLTKYFI